jgi:hypothetical protein
MVPLMDMLIGDSPFGLLSDAGGIGAAGPTSLRERLRVPEILLKIPFAPPVSAPVRPFTGTSQQTLGILRAGLASMGYGRG